MNNHNNTNNAINTLNPLRRVIARYPIGAFVLFAVGLNWLLMGGLMAVGGPTFLGLLMAAYCGLFGGSVLITRWTTGRDGLSRFFAGIRRWRFRPSYYLLVVAALPLITIIIAFATHTYQPPEGGWAGTISTYIITTLAGALTFNIWEEAGWGGFMQTRLMERRGLLAGSLLTSVAFIAFHVPLAIEPHGLTGTSFRALAIGLAPFVIFSPFLRYLIGIVLIETGGSILAIGLLHASFNASTSLGAVTSQTPAIAATIVVTLVVGVYHKLFRK